MVLQLLVQIVFLHMYIFQIHVFNAILIVKKDNVLKQINALLVSVKMALVQLQEYVELVQITVFLANQMELDNVTLVKIIIILLQLETYVKLVLIIVKHVLLGVNVQHVTMDTINLEQLAVHAMILKNVLVQIVIHYLIVILKINGANISQLVLLFLQLLL